MSDTFTIEIITPDRMILNSKVSEVIIPSYEGHMGILKDHIPLITFLRPGFVKIKNVDEKKYGYHKPIMLAGGVGNISDNHTHKKRLDENVLLIQLGGPGMLMKVEPLKQAIAAAKAKNGSNSKVIYLSPQGQTLTQEKAQQLASEDSLIFISGRYEGIDERLIQTQVDEEISIGDYVLSGGELAAMVVMDSIIRLVPEVLGHDQSAVEDSFVDGLLDCPHYTRPENIDGLDVPEVLLSGNHEKIKRWRLKQALGRTWQRRPDLMEKRLLNKIEQSLLQEFIREVQGHGDT